MISHPGDAPDCNMMYWTVQIEPVQLCENVVPVFNKIIVVCYSHLPFHTVF